MAFAYKLHKWRIIIWPQGVTLAGSGMCTACGDIQTSQKGKIQILLDNMKYTTEKKSQCSIYQAYEVLHEYI